MWICTARSHKNLARAKHYGADTVVQIELSLNAVGSRHRWLSSLWMQQEDCSMLWDLQQKMHDGRILSVCNVGPPVCSVEQTEDAAVTQ